MAEPLRFTDVDVEISSVDRWTYKIKIDQWNEYLVGTTTLYISVTEETAPEPCLFTADEWAEVCDD